ncbi:hypothetical protein CK203_039785 [Vitis vinifera]|uniref:Reverse transcriptase/retrotransposon-derived protein RNase H-like domain-containing protein n=1 Tax=Vitis vinifera TaxID=29760 RepID=A0A438HQA5_VITVI|nr:hypothetical protein CK203_039785 [Vitis vinifera]
MVTQRGIEVNPIQIKVVLETPVLSSKKELQHLTSRLAVLKRFIAYFIDKLRHFFLTLRKASTFSWTDEYRQAFEVVKRYLTELPILSSPEYGENSTYIWLYLTMSGSDNVCLPLSHALNYTRTVCSTNEADPGWMHDIAKYLQMGELPEDEKQTYKLRIQKPIMSWPNSTKAYAAIIQEDKPWHIALTRKGNRGDRQNPIECTKENVGRRQREMGGRTANMSYSFRPCLWDGGHYSN